MTILADTCHNDKPVNIFIFINIQYAIYSFPINSGHTYIMYQFITKPNIYSFTPTGTGTSIHTDRKSRTQ